MFVNNKEMLVGAVSTAMIGFGGLALRKIAAKAAPTVGLALAVVAVPAALFVMPQAALADNECGADAPDVNGALADSYDCPDANYAEGVTYAADGDLTVNFTNGSLSVIGENPDNGTDPTDRGGIDLSATGGDSIVFDSAATQIRSNGVLGALLNVTTADGAIGIDTGIVDADANTPTGVTHGIYAESTGSGSIDITTTGNVDAQSGDNPADSIGIEAITNSGDIVITAEGAVRGNQHGIRAAAGGSGTLSITALGAAAGSDAAIDATTGTGLLTIDIDEAGSGTIFGGGGTAIRANAGGDAQIDVSRAASVSGNGTALDVTVAGTATVTVDGSLTGSGSNDVTAIRAAGDGNLIVANNNVISGQLDFSELDNGYTFSNNAGAAWNVGTSSDLGSGTFNNAGTINFDFREVVFAEETAFDGSGASLLTMPMTLDTTAQASCAAVTIAPCLDLSGGSTSGQTEILISVVAPPLDPEGDLSNAANAGILLVDVSGGTSAAEHFVLDPASENYAMDARYGGIIDPGPGPLVYTLLYNPDTQQHGLSTVPTDEGITYAAFNQEVLSMWHTSADAVAGRQADLREGAARGGWVRVVSDSSERESTLSLTTHGNTFTYDQDYDLDTTAVMFGSDVHSGDNHIIGLHAGLVRSHLEFENSSNRDRTKGAAAGVYGGWWRDLGAGQLTLDGTLNTNFLRLKHKNSFEVTDTDVRSLGVRAEAGWLLPVGQSFYVQPLATAAYVRADIETITLRKNDLRFEEANSERAALGVRLGGDVDLSGNRFGYLKYWLTARAWEENAEDGSVDYQTTGEPLSIEDDISESFEEVGLGVSLTSPDNNLNVFLSGGLQSGDQTDSTNVTIGARLRW